MMKKFNIFVRIALLTAFIFSCKDNSSSPQSAGIDGTVSDRKTGYPIADALITTLPVTESILANDKGAFSFKDVTPGDYIVYAEKDGYYKGSAMIKVSDGKTSKAAILLSSLVSGNHPPNTPFNPYPANGGTINKDNVSLRWSCSDPDGDKLTYTVTLSKVNPPTNPIADNLADTTFNLTNLEDSTDYYWMVTAKDIYGATAQSSIWKFHSNIKGSSSGTLDDYIAYYQFDGNSKDSGPFGYDGNQNQVNFINDRKNNPSSAIYFNGGLSYVNLIHQEIFNFQKDLTVALWIKPNIPGCFPYDNHIDLICIGVPGTEIATGAFGVTTNYEIEFWGNKYGPANWNIRTTKQVSQTGWTHVAFVFSYQTNNSTFLKIYINGNVESSGYLNIPDYNQNSVVGIGHRIFDEMTRYAGGMDDLYIYDRALSNLEINQLMNK